MAFENRQKGLDTAQARLLGEQPVNYPNQFVETKAAENAFDFGKAVVDGTAATQVKLIAGAAGQFAGIAFRGFDGQKVDSDNQVIGYAAKDVVGVLKTGYGVVYANEALGEADTVRVYHTVGAGSEEPGTFAKTAEAGKTAVLSGAKFKSTVAAAGNVDLFLDDTVTKSLTADV